MGFLPDTNIIIAWFAEPEGNAAWQIARNRREIALSSIVKHELYFGAYKSQNIERNLRRLEGLSFPVLEFDDQDARAAGEIRARLKRAGTPIGPYDALIAGQALARGLTLVTNNMREFERVEGLKLEDWTFYDIFGAAL